MARNGSVLFYIYYLVDLKFCYQIKTKIIKQKSKKKNHFNSISGDTCCFSFSLGSFTKSLKTWLGQDTYVKSIRIGNNIIEDFESGYFVHPNKQVEDACRQIANDKRLENGYNAIGFSQGGQFL